MRYDALRWHWREAAPVIRKEVGSKNNPPPVQETRARAASATWGAKRNVLHACLLIALAVSFMQAPPGGRGHPLALFGASAPHDGQGRRWVRCGALALFPSCPFVSPPLKQRQCKSSCCTVPSSWWPQAAAMLQTRHSSDTANLFISHQAYNPLERSQSLSKPFI